MTSSHCRLQRSRYSGRQSRKKYYRPSTAYQKKFLPPHSPHQQSCRQQSQRCWLLLMPCSALHSLEMRLRLLVLSHHSRRCPSRPRGQYPLLYSRRHPRRKQVSGKLLLPHCYTHPLLQTWSSSQGYLQYRVAT